MNKQPEITAATRQRFVDVFCALYATQPISKINVKEIAARAGYNRSTFYQYFNDVYDIQNYIENQLMDDIRKNVFSQLSLDLRNHTVGDSYLTLANAFLHTNETRLRLLLANPYNHHFPVRLKDEALHVFIDTLSLPSKDATVYYTFEFYIGGVLSLISKWLTNQNAISLEELTALVKNILENGVLAQLSECQKTAQ